jgi:hypothetical protein
MSDATSPAVPLDATSAAVPVITDHEREELRRHGILLTKMEDL